MPWIEGQRGPRTVAWDRPCLRMWSDREPLIPASASQHWRVKALASRTRYSGDYEISIQAESQSHTRLDRGQFVDGELAEFSDQFDRGVSSEALCIKSPLFEP